MFYYNYNRTFIIGKGAMLCYAMLCCAMLCYAMLCYAVLCYAMLCCAMLCYAVLCYSTVTTLAKFLGLSGLMFLLTER